MRILQSIAIHRHRPQQRLLRCHRNGKWNINRNPFHSSNYLLSISSRSLANTTKLHQLSQQTRKSNMRWIIFNNFPYHYGFSIYLESFIWCLQFQKFPSNNSREMSIIFLHWSIASQFLVPFCWKLCLIYDGMKMFGENLFEIFVS